MRLIDAEELERLFYEKVESGATDLFDAFEDALQEAQTVDAVPVVHGWWLTWEEQFPGRTPRKKSMLGVFCSACHNHADNMSNYCPNCGAKMDADTQEREETK